MAKSSCLLLVLGGLLSGTLANHGNSPDFSSNCCKFTLSSTGGFDCPAGELLDGQIRLNGTYDSSTFCLDKEGGITNSRGFGCIVTNAPTTQIQCDEGKKPTPGFSIGTNNTLFYKGSPSFFACPATDTEYNIYVSPNFGQTKCFPITLQSDGCGGTQECAPASTVWQTSWYTQVVNQTVMLTQTELVPCSTSAPPPPPPPPPVTTPSAIPTTNSTKPCTKSKCHPSSQAPVPSPSPSGKPPCGHKGECTHGNIPSEGAPWQNHTLPEVPGTSSSSSTASTSVSTSLSSPLPGTEMPPIETSTAIIPPVGAPEAGKLP